MVYYTYICILYIIHHMYVYWWTIRQWYITHTYVYYILFTTCMYTGGPSDSGILHIHMYIIYYSPHVCILVDHQTVVYYTYICILYIIHHMYVYWWTIRQWYITHTYVYYILFTTCMYTGGPSDSGILHIHMYIIYYSLHVCILVDHQTVVYYTYICILYIIHHMYVYWWTIRQWYITHTYVYYILFTTCMYTGGPSDSGILHIHMYIIYYSPHQRWGERTLVLHRQFYIGSST